MPWPEVARAVGYISGPVAQMAVTAYLQKAVAESGPQYRQLALQTELDRFDALQAAWWQRALNGDIQAAKVILQISDRRARLEGFDQAGKANAAPEQLVSRG